MGVHRYPKWCEGRITCVCECEFNYSYKDIEDGTNGSGGKHFVKKWYKFVRCPICKHKHILYEIK